jgi:hypothetical protein
MENLTTSSTTEKSVSKSKLREGVGMFDDEMELMSVDRYSTSSVGLRLARGFGMAASEEGPPSLYPMSKGAIEMSNRWALERRPFLGGQEDD